MKKMFKASKSRLEITQIEVDRQTASFVYQGKYRTAKQTEFYSIFETEKEAKQFLIDLREDQILNLKNRIITLENEIDKINANNF